MKPSESIPSPPVPTSWDRECMAWHEAGHAVVSLSFPEREPVERVSIVPGDEAFGLMRTAVRPHHNDTRETLLAALSVALAGREAERLFLRRETTSGGDDLAMARAIARDMVLRFGLGPRLGMCCPAGPDEAMSERLRRAVEADEIRLLRAALRAARSALRRRRRDVRAVALALLERGTLDVGNVGCDQTLSAT